MKNPFKIDDVIEGLERKHSMSAGLEEIWHRLKVLDINGNRMQLQMVDDPKFIFWVSYKPQWFRAIN